MDGASRGWAPCPTLTAWAAQLHEGKDSGEEKGQLCIPLAREPKTPTGPPANFSLHLWGQNHNLWLLNHEIGQARLVGIRAGDGS